MSERINSNERGAALLFAMGLLALFLLLAMAFAANSLLQRKIAANRSSRSMVEVIADSATERVRTMLFYYQGNVNSTWIDGKADVNRLGSYIDDTDTDEKKLDGGEVVADLLEVQKLGGVLYEENDYKQCPYVMAGIAHNTATCPICSNWQLPDWRLVKNRQTASVDEIVGRYAYVMLPPTPRYFVDRDADNLPVWHTFEELFSGLTTKNKDNLRTAKREVEIYYPPALEAYVCNTVNSSVLPRRPLPEEFFKRFNLNRSDWDTVTVEALLESAPVHFYQGTDSGSGFTFTYGSKNELLANTATPANGIQFLRRVGNDKATFASLAERRQQIAANLIDYCDTDNIPTSNTSKPYNWMTDSPAYTGNEKTWFIDRVGLVTRPNLTATLSDNSTQVRIGMSSDQNAALVGLVDVFNAAQENTSYQAQVKINKLMLHIEVSGAVTYGYSYKDKTSPTPDETITGYGTTAYTLPTKASTVSGIVNTVVSVDFPADTTQIGYRAAAKGFTGFPGFAPFYIDDFSADFRTWLVANDSTFSNILSDPGRYTLETLAWLNGDISVKITAVEVGIDRVVLSRQQDGNFNNVDVSLLNFEKSYSLSDYISYRNNGGTISQGDMITLGGLFAKDPRQNLFAADWYLATDGTVVGDNALEGQKISDIFGATFTFDTGNPFSGYLLQGTGLQPMTAAPLADRNPSSGPDQESVTTPAWAGNAANQHLSTAFFRNAPMESLAELGFIHRGAMWETLNLANAESPDHVNEPVHPEDYVVVDYTTATGTTYEQGDGGLLDQVKVTDKNFLYDSYDLNLRDGSGVLNDKFIGDEYYWRLLKGIRLGALQTAGADVDAIGSQSDGTAVTDLKNGGNTVIANALISRLNWKYETDEPNAPPVYSNRAQMLWYPNNSGRFFDAYTTLTGANANGLDINKALHDELNAKTMERTAAGGLPTVYRVLVLAQSIRDIGADSTDEDDGFTMRIDTDGNGTPEDYTGVLLGKYEAGADEITGQLRMIVTFVRDPVTLQVKIKDIEYLED